MVKKVVEKSEQSTLSKAVKNVKQKLLTTENKPEIEKPTEITAPKIDLVKLNRGVVYLGHIPHGFFEEQMRDYFKQFGKVTRVRLVRSKKTGRSRGYGYVEFLHSEVAEIAAESMNNYLMCGRLLKATYIPPEKQHSGFFIGRQWSKQKYPRLVNRKEQNTQKNRNVDNKVEAGLVARGLSKISNIEKKLAAVGIVYSINPVEVPPPVIKKRKAVDATVAQLPTVELKKRKIASGDSDEKKEKKDKIEKKDKKEKIEKTANKEKTTKIEKVHNVEKKETKQKKEKKEIKVAEPLVQTIKTKNAKNEVLSMKTKKNKKVGSMVKSIVEERSKRTRVLRNK